jgi:hypothetical protein
MIPDFGPIIFPVAVAVILSVSGAYVVARYSGPAQTAYVAAITGRLAIVIQERDEARLSVTRLTARVEALETEADRLQGEVIELYRKLDLPAAPRRRARP